MIYRSRTIRSARLQKKKKIFMYIWLTLAAILLAGAFYGINYLANHPSFQINEVVIEGNTYASEKEINELIQSTMAKNRLVIFPNSNIYLYPRFKTEAILKKNYPSMQKVDIDISGRHTLNVFVKEYQPVALWCSGMALQKTVVEIEENATTSANSLFENETGPNVAELTEIKDIIIHNPWQNRRNDCYLMNESGYIYGDATSTAGFVAYHGILEGDPKKQLYTTKTFFKSMHRFTEHLDKKLHIKARDVITRDNSTFIIITDNDAQLFIDKNDNLIDVVDNLKTVIDRDAINEAQLENIEYIDLRFGNRVFYKLR